MDDERSVVLPYLRQSKARAGETRDTSLSFDAQLLRIRQWAERHGHHIAPEIRDHDEVGSDPTRPGLRELQDRVRPGVIVAVYSFDRFARDLLLQEQTVQALERRGVSVISVSEPSTKLARQMFGAMSEHFRDQLSARIKSVREAQGARGQFLGSHPPYGYQRRDRIETIDAAGARGERATGPLVPNPDEAAIVVEMATRVANGEALFAIARDLDRREVPTKRGMVWRVSNVRKIITNPVHVGSVKHRGQVVARNAHPAILDEELFDAVQRRLSRAVVRRSNPSQGIASWCAGSVEHICGRRMYLYPALSRGKTYATFACATMYQPQRCADTRRIISARKLEAAVRICLVSDLSRILSLDEVIRHAELAAGGADTARARKALDQRRRLADMRLDRARDRWLAGREPDAWMDTEDARYATDLAGIAADLALLPAPPDPARFRDMGAALADVGALIDMSSDDAMAHVLATVGVAIVSAAGVQMRYFPEFAPFIPRPRLVAIPTHHRLPRA